MSYLALDQATMILGTGVVTFKYHEITLSIRQVGDVVHVDTELDGIKMEEFEFDTAEEAMEWADTFLDGFRISRSNDDGQADGIR